MLMPQQSLSLQEVTSDLDSVTLKTNHMIGDIWLPLCFKFHGIEMYTFKIMFKIQNRHAGETKTWPSLACIKQK